MSVDIDSLKAKAEASIRARELIEEDRRAETENKGPVYGAEAAHLAHAEFVNAASNPEMILELIRQVQEARQERNRYVVSALKEAIGAIRFYFRPATRGFIFGCDSHFYYDMEAGPVVKDDDGRIHDIDSSAFDEIGQSIEKIVRHLEKLKVEYGPKEAP